MVLDDKTCPVGMVWNLEHFFAQESCGWCTPCWSGLAWTEKILLAMEQGHGEQRDLETLDIPDQVSCAREHVLRLCAGSGGAAAKRFEIFRATISTGISPKSAVRGDDDGNDLHRKRAQTADPKQNLLHACLSLGYDLPYFCWHPALGSVGACRQCAVKQFKDEQDTTRQDRDGLHDAGRGWNPHLDQRPGSRGVSGRSDPGSDAEPSARLPGLRRRRRVPPSGHDGDDRSSLRALTAFGKRTFRNQYLGPFINHEMNRCIQCQRCVRFYREYAGGHDLNAFRLRDTRVLRPRRRRRSRERVQRQSGRDLPDGRIHRCYVEAPLHAQMGSADGAFDLRALRFGCNITAGERYGTLRRVENRYNGQVNGYFLCDRGRFGYEFVRERAGAFATLS